MLTIHGAPPSIHTRKVIVTALEKGLDYEIAVVFPFDPPEGWRTLSPTGRIPALTDGDFHVADSSVIVAYLERRHPARAVLPADPVAHARALWFEEYADSQVAPHVAAIFHQKVLGPMHGRPADANVLDELVTGRLAPAFDYLEASLVDGWLSGDTFSVADIAVASNLVMYHYLGYSLDESRYAKLRAHFIRALARPAFRTAMAAEQPFVEKLGLDDSTLPSTAREET